MSDFNWRQYIRGFFVKPVRMLLFAITALLILAAVEPAKANEEWLEKIPESETLTPQFFRNVLAGEVFLVKTVRDNAISLTFDGGERGGLAILYPVLGTTPIGDKVILKSGKPETLLYSFMEADGIAVKIFTGAGELSAKLLPMEEQVIKEGEEGTFSIPSFKEVTGRFVNVSDFRSMVRYEFFLGDESISKSSMRSRTFTLDFRGSGKEKAWKSTADSLKVLVIKGEVLAKVGHIPSPE